MNTKAFCNILAAKPLPIGQRFEISSVAADLGIGKSTLDRWRRTIEERYLLAGLHEDVNLELARLRRENELLRQERDLLKKATAFFARETSR